MELVESLELLESVGNLASQDLPAHLVLPGRLAVPEPMSFLWGTCLLYQGLLDLPEIQDPLGNAAPQGLVDNTDCLGHRVFLGQKGLSDPEETR